MKAEAENIGSLIFNQEETFKALDPTISITDSVEKKGAVEKRRRVTSPLHEVGLHSPDGAMIRLRKLSQGRLRIVVADT